MNDKIKMTATITDTFGKEANFSWVNKESFIVDSDISNRQALKLIREKFGITNKLRLEYDLSDEIRYNFDKACITLFINFEY